MVISNRKPMKEQSKCKTNAAGSPLYNCLAGRERIEIKWQGRFTDVARSLFRLSNLEF
jgi:hypothetical protein